jgi:large subunit ribosomal protein L15
MADENKIPILSRLRPPTGAVKDRRRLGRGLGSGLGKTAGKGMKGQKARHPVGFRKLGFEGGQTPLQRRMPKAGFVRPFPEETATVNVRDLARFAAGSTVDEKALRDARLVKGQFVRLKVLGVGDLGVALTVRVHAVSASAKDKIEKAGGKIDLLPTTQPPRATA